MASNPVQQMQEELLSATRKSQEIVLQAVKTWVDSAQAGLIDAVTADPAPGDVGEADATTPQTEDAIRADGRLSEEQKAALIAVYRSMLN